MIEQKPKTKDVDVASRDNLSQTRMTTPLFISFLPLSKFVYVPWLTVQLACVSHCSKIFWIRILKLHRYTKIKETICRTTRMTFRTFSTKVLPAFSKNSPISRPEVLYVIYRIWKFDTMMCPEHELNCFYLVSCMSLANVLSLPKLFVHSKISLI